jgi:hypothetical protein
MQHRCECFVTIAVIFNFFETALQRKIKKTWLVFGRMAAQGYKISIFA